MAMAPEQLAIGIRRHFTTPELHPYDQVTWEQRDARITNFRDGSVAFEQCDVEFPVDWSLNATNIVAQKYFRGTLDTPEREWSLKQVADRVVDTITEWGLRDGYFVDDEEAETFRAELKFLIISQRAAFNSPVWFNIGVAGVPQQASACQPYDALVSTPEGLMPIGRLVDNHAVGTKVLDAHGVTRIVAVKHNGRKQVLRVVTKAGHRLDVTADHLVWRASGDGTGRFVEAGSLQRGDQLCWHRTESWGSGEISSVEIAEAALAGWLQSDGFVGQYENGTNRSLTLEFMTVTEAEHAWIMKALDETFPGVHRKVRPFATQSDALVGRRIRLYGEVLRPFVERWGLLARGTAMVVPENLFTAALPVAAAYLRSLFQADGYVSLRPRAAVVGLDMIAVELVHGVQQLLSRFGIYGRVGVKRDRREDRHDLAHLGIRALPDRRRFADEIGFVDPLKASKLDASFDIPGIRDASCKRLEVACIELRGEMDVYDIQTESGEYLSSGLRVHNCFILSVNDKMQSILNWYVEEGTIFKGGSGAGINLSRIRSSREPLQGGGTASGPVSFMRGADASAGTIKSGGKTRRAAKMVILDVDHPDVEEFIWCKAREEQKARVLRDAGFDMDLDGADSHSTQYQNANNSVRVTDDFMRAVENDEDWYLTGRTDGSVIRTVRARDLFRQIAQAAWECADPGMQFDTTINHWHTAASTGRINGSNPCSEYMHLDNSACNLASLNLLKFLDGDDRFDVEAFRHAVEVVFTAQEILVGNADYPTEPIAENSRRFRQLGLGYANLGALLMALGLPYDSDEGRALAGAITSLMTGHAYATSARTAGRMGPFSGYAENEEHMLRVLEQHRAAAGGLADALVPADLIDAARRSWDEACEYGAAHGIRNSQASVLAPTGCLVGGTFVATERGLVRLASLGDPDGAQWQPLDVAVATDNGEQQATQFYVNGLEPVVDVTTHRGYHLAGTTKHRIKVVDADGNHVWKRLADLVSGDEVPLALDQLVGEPRAVELPPAQFGLGLPTTMTAELAELVGYIGGVGGLEQRFGPYLSTPYILLDGQHRLAALSKECFGEDITEVGSSADRIAIDLWLRQTFDAAGAQAHRVPVEVLATNDRHTYCAYLRGLLEATGTIDGGGLPRWELRHRQLAEEVQSLLLALGYVADRGSQPTGRHPHVVELRRDQARGFTDEIGFMSEAKDRMISIRPVPRQPFFYDRVESAVLGDEEFTYDLSVPANVTYIANGFVSHNTIGLMMDCDTTGIEPDLGLCKMKKLVGGGTMTIVNQTIPRALRRLGYDPGQVNEIVAYIDEHKTILGAPHLAAEHVPVFACSMGDNAIHYLGHVQMMGAVQPFISGAISKTVNMPEQATIEDVEALHLDAWKLGLKAVAIYRDNCKVAQPLSQAKKEGADTEPAAAATATVETIVEKIVHKTFREKLQRSRASRTFEFRVADCKGFVTVGEYEDGRPGEIFIRVAKQGSTLAGFLDAFAISISHGLQYGVPLRSFVEAFTGMRFEPAGMTDDPDIRIANSLVDYLFRRLALMYLSKEERAELNIYSTEERMQPTLPGVEESVIETRQGHDVAADPPSVPSASELAAQMAAPAPAPQPVKAPDAPMCMQCGVQMMRAGSCHACPSCGTTSGCS